MIRQLRSLFALAALLLAFALPLNDALASGQLLYNLDAAGTALSNSTTETVLASTSLPAHSLQAGKVYHLRAAVIATATNSTDTLTVKVRIGPTTLTGTVVGSSGAVDVADNDVVIVDLVVTVRDADSSSNVLVAGFVSAPGAEGTATARVAFEAFTTLDATVAQKVEITGTWSAASASDSCRADVMVLDEEI